MSISKLSDGVKDSLFVTMVLQKCFSGLPQGQPARKSERLQTAPRTKSLMLCPHRIAPSHAALRFRILQRESPDRGNPSVRRFDFERGDAGLI